MIIESEGGVASRWVLGLRDRENCCEEECSVVKWGYTLVKIRQSVPLKPVLFITVNYARVLKKIGTGG